MQLALHGSGKLDEYCNDKVVVKLKTATRSMKLSIHNFTCELCT